jgi:TetR/AcrR family transcriptional regulator, cholesterol catabolism regulator
MDRQKEVLISDSELRGLTVDNYRTIINLRDNYQQKFQNLLKKGIDEGIFSEKDYRIVSYGMLTMCTAVSIWFRASGRLSKKIIAETYTDFIINGLKQKERPYARDRHQGKKGGGKGK